MDIHVKTGAMKSAQGTSVGVQQYRSAAARAGSALLRPGGREVLVKADPNGDVRG